MEPVKVRQFSLTLSRNNNENGLKPAEVGRAKPNCLSRPKTRTKSIQLTLIKLSIFMDFPANEIMRAHIAYTPLATDATGYALMQVQFEQHKSGQAHSSRICGVYSLGEATGKFTARFSLEYWKILRQAGSRFN